MMLWSSAPCSCTRSCRWCCSLFRSLGNLHTSLLSVSFLLNSESRSFRRVICSSRSWKDRSFCY